MTGSREHKDDDEVSAMKAMNEFLDLVSQYSVGLGLLFIMAANAIASAIAGWASEFQGDNLKLVSASSSPAGKTVFEFKVKANHCNGLGNLHGGCCATLFDWCTTTAIVPVSKPNFWVYKGVSRTLNVTYLKPVPEGEVVLIESEILSIGKRLCTIKGTMRRKSDGALLTICEHGKVNVGPDANSKM